MGAEGLVAFKEVEAATEKTAGFLGFNPLRLSRRPGNY